MRIRVIVAWLALLLLFPSAAFASLADEERQGEVVSAQLNAGTKSCGDLSAEDFDHIGEYVMGHFLGSAAAHEAMNERMRATMGDQLEERMHQLIGARFAGCAVPAGATSGHDYGSMMGSGGMMGGYYGNGGWSAMMRSGNYSWMMGGAWRNMSRQDWQRIQQQLLGTTGHGDGWSAWAIAAVALAALVLGGAIALVASHRGPFRRQPPAALPS